MNKLMVILLLVPTIAFGARFGGIKYDDVEALKAASSQMEVATYSCQREFNRNEYGKYCARFTSRYNNVKQLRNKFNDRIWMNKTTSVERYTLDKASMKAKTLDTMISLRRMLSKGAK